MNPDRFKTPNTYFLIFAIIVLTAALTWVVPGGEYERLEADGRLVVQPGTYRTLEARRQGLGAILMAPIRGFADPEAARIIGFVLLVGGAFSVLQRTGAVDAGIKGLAHAHGRYAWIRTLWIPLFMTLFSLGGAVFGMSEEVIPFILIFVPLALALGCDSVVGVSIPFIGAGVGFAGAFLNPFTLGIAQGIAQVSIFSGLKYRVLCWAVVTTIAVVFVLVYAARIRRDPTMSPTYQADLAKRGQLDLSDLENFQGLTRAHKTVLLVFGAGLIVLAWGVLHRDWFIEEIAGLFLALGIVCGVASRLSIQEITDSFLSGARDLVGTGIIICLARGILIVARDGQIIDTVLRTLATGIRTLPPVISAQAMFVMQTVINFFVPSGSGQAALTMPIMAPLGDLVGVSRQTAVLAFQFGDGFSNMIIPTSAVCMGVLTLAGIPWQRWARWILPLQLSLVVAGFLLLVPPFFMDW